jgi:uncharacterized LabA/DUF88 family protein
MKEKGNAEPGSMLLAHQRSGWASRTATSFFKHANKTTTFQRRSLPTWLSVNIRKQRLMRAVVFIALCTCCSSAYSLSIPRQLSTRRANTQVSLLGVFNDNEYNDSTIQTLEEKLKCQQQQINSLMQLLASQHQGVALSSGATQQINNSNPPNAISIQHPLAAAATVTAAPLQQKLQYQQTMVAPLKAMLFIDGSWLYYSIYERSDCPIKQKFGFGWQYRYKVAWSKLPGLICRYLASCRHISSTSSQVRHIELVRTSVYTSYKADTHERSFRYQMFEELKEANFDLHMMETVGKSEKCIDIQIAVDLLHYATVDSSGGGAFDIGLLLTGDKDFIPALIRARQKGREIGIVSMQRGCNRALLDTPGIRDFDVMWLEDYMDELLIPIVVAEKQSDVSVFTLHKCIHDYILESGDNRVSKRDLGRYLKSLLIADTNVLNEMKAHHGGMNYFVASSGHYDITEDFDEDDPTYNISFSLKPNAVKELLAEAKKTKLSAAEKKFFTTYNVEILKDKQKYYPRKFWNDLRQDFNGRNVSVLKEACRDFGLAVSGRKQDLVKRIEDHLSKQARDELQKTFILPIVDPIIGNYLKGIVVEFLKAKGGEASSREIGRYLGVNKSSESTLSAHYQMKLHYGSLRGFFLTFLDDFEFETGFDENKLYEFNVKLKKKDGKRH